MGAGLKEGALGATFTHEKTVEWLTPIDQSNGDYTSLSWVGVQENPTHRPWGSLLSRSAQTEGLSLYWKYANKLLVYQAFSRLTAPSLAFCYATLMLRSVFSHGKNYRRTHVKPSIISMEDIAHLVPEWISRVRHRPSCNWLTGNSVQRQTIDLQVGLWGYFHREKVKCTGIRASIIARMWWKDWRWGQSIGELIIFYLQQLTHCKSGNYFFHLQSAQRLNSFSRGKNLVSVHEKWWLFDWFMIVTVLTVGFLFSFFLTWHWETSFLDVIK